MKKRIFSGAQPTGQLHIGNYLGALKNWVALQDEYESFYCIVNLHAITLPQDPKVLRQKTLDLARIYLAAGVDPTKSTVFIQSDVSEHAELTWILSCISRMGELERMTQFKDKGKGNTERAGVGLFTYPVLMAADILLYQTDLVPIGKDQKQHLELTRDVAERFNRDFGETFKIPEPFIPPVGANILSLQEPAKKMSKSDENASGSIFLLDDADTITKKIKRAVTDSGTDIRFDAGRPAITNLLTIFQLLTGKSPDECEAHFAGKGYGHLKTELTEVVVEFLRPFQEKVKEYDDASLNAILKPGAEKARGIASETLKAVYEKMGIS
jgi:tryptophanyl-tRNA synthetase